MPDTDTSERFLGLTKTQFLGSLVVLIIVIFAAQAYQLNATSSLAAKADRQAHVNHQLVIDGKEAHDALCVYKQSLADSITTSKAFLKLTLAERIEKYGSLGNVSDAYVKSQLAVQKTRLKSLDSLTCP